MEKAKLKAVLEAVLFMSTEPLTVSDLKKLVKLKAEEAPEGEAPAMEAAEEAGEIRAAEAVNEDVEVVKPAQPEAQAAPAEELDPLAQLQQMQTKLDEEISKSEIQELLNELIAEYRDNESRGFELVEIARGYQFRTKLALSPYLKNLYKLPKPRLSQPGMETLSIVAYQQPIARNRIEEIRGVDSGGVLKTLLERDLVRIVGRSEEPGRPILYGTTKAFLETFSLASLSDLPTLKDLANLDPTGTPGGLGAAEEGADPEFSEFDPIDASQSDFVPMDDESVELIDELESSMSQLKTIEKQIFEEKPSEEPAQAKDPQV